jgi:hypothetical protein
MVALRDARRLSWLLTTTAGAAVRVRMARRRGDGKTPSSPAEVTTLGTPQINPTPKALFPGSPTPRKGLGITFCEGVRRRQPPATVDGASPEGPLDSLNTPPTVPRRRSFATYDDALHEGLLVSLKACALTRLRLQIDELARQKQQLTMQALASGSSRIWKLSSMNCAPSRPSRIRRPPRSRCRTTTSPGRNAAPGTRGRRRPPPTHKARVGPSGSRRLWESGSSQWTPRLRHGPKSRRLQL